MDPTAGDSTASSLSDSRRDKEESLHRRRKHDRVWRALETGAQREERLRVRRERDRARRAAQSEEQRASVLLCKRKRLKKMADTKGHCDSCRHMRTRRPGRHEWPADGWVSLP